MNKLNPKLQIMAGLLSGEHYILFIWKPIRLNITFNLSFLEGTGVTQFTRVFKDKMESQGRTIEVMCINFLTINYIPQITLWAFW